MTDIETAIADKASRDGQFAIAYALLQCAREQRSIADAIRSLGLGDAASPMGAAEYMAQILDGAAVRICETIENTADAR